jgi:group I intron endonuclease
MHLETLQLYVGSSYNCGGRIKTHLRDATSGSRSCFHRALRQFGVDAFSFDLLEECERPLLHEREEKWILFYKSASLDGFNTMSKPGATYGWIMTEATRERMREAARKSNTPEKRERIRQALLGKRRSPMSSEQKDKLRQTSTGQKFSKERCANISKALTGKILSAEHRKNIGDARRGKTLSPEWKEKVRLSLLGNKRMLGKKLTPEHRAKIGAGCKGKMLGIKLSLEHRKKLSESHKGKKYAKRTSIQTGLH